MVKKVLIISNNALSFSANNGRTLNSFFADYDGEKLAQLFLMLRGLNPKSSSASSMSEPSNSCANFFQRA